jgi:hypothetical protein
VVYFLRGADDHPAAGEYTVRAGGVGGGVIRGCI